MSWFTIERYESMRTTVVTISPVRGSTNEGPTDGPGCWRCTQYITGYRASIGSTPAGSGSMRNASRQPAAWKIVFHHIPPSTKAERYGSSAARAAPGSARSTAP